MTPVDFIGCNVIYGILGIHALNDKHKYFVYSIFVSKETYETQELIAYLLSLILASASKLNSNMKNSTMVPHFMMNKGFSNSTDLIYYS